MNLLLRFRPIRRMFRILLFIICALFLGTRTWAEATPYAILVYHRFGPTVADSMTTRTSIFEAQLIRLRQDGYQFVPLTTMVDAIAGKTILPAKSLAITVDDGHRSVYTELLPVIRREHLPVTLFIYPSAISNASYALTWAQLSEIQSTGTVEIQSHTYWHPNFNIERKRLPPREFQQFVRVQLEKPRTVLKAKLGVDAPLLAWPYGIHDPELEAAASAAGYHAAFALGNRDATRADPLMALPRYLMADAFGVAGLLKMLRVSEQRTQEVSR